MNVWLASREYAGIAEAGGVKNVARSLAEALVRRGHRVTVFIPLYACTDIRGVQKFACVWHEPVFVTSGGKSKTITFCRGIADGVEIVFISHRQFAEKKAVYVYTHEDERLDPRNQRGTGHHDALELNVMFQKAVVAYGDTCAQQEAPDVIHCHDAACALIPPFMEFKKRVSPLAMQFYRQTRCIVTIHNAGPGYHHEFSSLKVAAHMTALPMQVLESGLCGQCVEPFLLAAQTSAMTTVSPQYAKEILNGTTETAGLGAAFSRAGIRITGITNGIDFDNYDPRDTSRSMLPFAFDPERMQLDGKYQCRAEFLLSYAAQDASCPDTLEKHGFLLPPEREGETPVFLSYHGRIVRQKGIDVLVQAIATLLEKKLPVRFLCMGQGEQALEDSLAHLCDRFAGKAVYFKGYDRSLTRLCTASADFALLPSQFEPCGLEDFIAQFYGTIPVAHATGGLCKIDSGETGFLYSQGTAQGLLEILEPLVRIKAAAPKIFLSMISFAARHTRETYSWDTVAAQYESLYAEPHAPA